MTAFNSAIGIGDDLAQLRSEDRREAVRPGFIDQPEAGHVLQVNLILPATLPEIPRIRAVIEQFRAIAGSARRGA